MTESGNAESAKRYFDDAWTIGDYYVRSGAEKETEERARWGGNGAARLGLLGPVEREAFHRLCDNELPDGSGRLTPRTKANRRVGYDLNFHVPKSISVLYALTGDQEILDAFRASVMETMKLLEAEARTRVRVGGRQENRITGELIWAEFVHKTTRPMDGVPDPHLHAHCFTLNATFDAAENRWKAGELSDINRHIGFYEAYFHAVLSKRVAELGYPIERVGRFWEVTAVPLSVREKFSRRSDEIGRFIAEKGLDDPRQKAGAGARTRKPKSESRPWREVEAAWRERLSPEEFLALSQAKKDGPRKPIEARQALQEAIATCLDGNWMVSEWTLLEEALRIGVGGVTLEALRDELSRAELIERVVRGERHFTTTAAMEAEDEVVNRARASRGGAKPFSTAKLNAAAELNPNDRERLAALLASPDEIVLTRTPNSPRGKLFRDAVAAAFEEAGYAVTMVTVDASPRKGSNGSVPLPSLASVLADAATRERIRSGVLWVEGADSLSANDARALLSAAKEHSFRILLSGEPYRAKSGQRKSLLRLFEVNAGLGSAERDRYRERANERLRAAKEFAGDENDRIHLEPELENEARADSQGNKKENGKASAQDGKPGKQSTGERDDKETGKGSARNGKRGRQSRRSRGNYRDRRDFERAFEALQALGDVVEVPKDELINTAAAMYVRSTKRKQLPLVLAASHGKELVSAIREKLREGRLLSRGRKFDMLKRVPATAHQMRDSRFYEKGQVVVFFRKIKGFRAGTHYKVMGRDLFGNVLVRNGLFIEALPLDKTEQFGVYRRTKIELARGDVIRITATGRTKNEGFGYEKLMSERGQAVRLANLKMFGLNVPDRRYRVPRDSLHRIRGFTLSGDVKLDNGWVLPKNFGRWDYGYCAGSMGDVNRTIDHAIVVSSADDSPRTLPRLNAEKVKFVSIVTDSLAALIKAVAEEQRARDSRFGDGSRNEGERYRYTHSRDERTAEREREAWA